MTEQTTGEALRAEVERVTGLPATLSPSQHDVFVLSGDVRLDVHDAGGWRAANIRKVLGPDAAGNMPVADVIRAAVEAMEKRGRDARAAFIPDAGCPEGPPPREYSGWAWVFRPGATPRDVFAVRILRARFPKDGMARIAPAADWPAGARWQPAVPPRLPEGDER